MPLIAGKVVDEQGRPVAWARVLFTRSPVPLPDIAQLTGEDGSFVTSVPENGTYEITTISEDERSGQAFVEVSSDRHEIEVQIGKLTG